MSRHRTATRLSTKGVRLLAAPAFGALGVTFLAVLVPPSALAADKDCGDFASQADAQAHFTSSGGSTVNNVDNLDANHNGVACENFTYAVGAVNAAPDVDSTELAPAEVPQGGVAAGDGDAGGLFRLF